MKEEQATEKLEGTGTVSRFDMEEEKGY